MPPVKRIALLNLPIAPDQGVTFYSGLCRFIYEVEPWEFVFNCEASSEALKLLEELEWDGAIVRVTDPKTAEWLKQLNKPIVNISAWLEHPNVPTVRPDERETGTVAARFLLEKGLSRFATIRRRGDGWYQHARSEGFIQTIRKAGFECSTYNQTASLAAPSEAIAFQDWIGSLHEPIGIYISDDGNVQNVVDSLKRAGLQVPRDAALVGSTNDPEAINRTTPPLSTVQHDLIALGYQAAEMLSEQMNGRNLSPCDLNIPPEFVEERGSSEIIALEDLEIRRAVAFLRSQFTRPIAIEDVAEHLGMSRSTLYRQFVKSVQQTPHDYIQMLRVQRAQEHFRSNPSACLEDIAVKCGFSGRKHLNQAFLKRTSLSASQWRAQL